MSKTLAQQGGKCTECLIEFIVAKTLCDVQQIQAGDEFTSICGRLNQHTDPREACSSALAQEQIGVLCTRGKIVPWINTEPTKVYYNGTRGHFLCGRNGPDRVKLNSVSKARLAQDKRRGARARLDKEGSNDADSDSESEDYDETCKLYKLGEKRVKTNQAQRADLNETGEMYELREKRVKKNQAESADLDKEVADSYSEEESEDIESDFSRSWTTNSEWEDSQFDDFDEETDKLYELDWWPQKVHDKYYRFLAHHKADYFREESGNYSKHCGFDNNGLMLHAVATPYKQIAELRFFGMDELDLSWLVPISYVAWAFPEQILVNDTHLPSPTKTICWCHVKACQQAPMC